MEKGFVIAIDGPVAAGKSTIATSLAKKLGGYHLYTGSMYRAVTLYCLENNIDVKNEEKVVGILPKIHIDFKNGEVCLNGKNVCNRVKNRDVEQAVPTVSDYLAVRIFLKEQQQRIGNEKIEQGKLVIADGRDMAMVVFPQAKLKIYLTASPEIRAKRRLKQMRERGITDITYDQTLEDTIKRDNQDMHGKQRYLVENPQAHGYIVIDDSSENQTQTVVDILQLIKKQTLL